MIRYSVIEVDATDKATFLGTLDSLSECPASTAETTVYAIKTYTFANSEMWWHCRGTGEWHRHGLGDPMEHWKGDV